MIWKKTGPCHAVLLAGVLWTGLWMTGCGSRKTSDEASAAGGKPDSDEARVVLRVGSVSYRASDFRRHVQEVVGGVLQELEAAALSHMFDQFVDEKILLSEALERGIVVSDEDKRVTLDAAEEGTWTEEEKAAMRAADSGPVIDKIRVEKLIRELTREIAVGDDEVKVYYDSHPGEFSVPERIRVSQILDPSEPEAIEVWEKSSFADEEGFRALARAKSVGPEAANGGEMGIFQKGQLPPDMEAAVFAMAEGEVSPVVESSYGFHIFRLDKKIPPEQIPLEKAAPSIRKKLLGLKVEAATARHLEELKKNLDWEVFPENLFFPYHREDT